MIQKKICMLGAFAVGKTSLTSRFVHSIFSDRYLTTVGVKIEKRAIDLGETTMELIVWDLYGEDEFQKTRTSYLRGASGYLLVVDGTRPATLETALGLHDLAQRTIGRVPFLLVANKADLSSQWQLDDLAMTKLTERGWQVVRTSAKTGSGVPEAFSSLARAMLRG